MESPSPPLRINPSPRLAYEALAKVNEDEVKRKEAESRPTDSLRRNYK